MRTVRFAFDEDTQMNVSKSFALANLKAIENGIKPIFRNEKDMVRKALMLGLQEISEEYKKFPKWYKSKKHILEADLKETIV